MSEFEANGSHFDWESDDFMDVAEPIVEEDDPWGTSADEERVVGGGATEGDQEFDVLQCQSRGSAQKGLGTEPRSSARESGDGVSAKPMQDRTSLDLVNGSEPSGDDPWRLDDEEALLTNGFDYLDEDEIEFDEPEVVAEYDGELGEVLYEPTGTSEDLAQTLRIDEFITYVRDANWQQKSYCAEMLGELSAARLRRWLTWLRRRVWTGRSLLLFLDFRINCWEENDEWWEFNVWREWTGHWWTYSNPGTLSLDATYELITLRMAYPAEQIIDKSWFDDWNEHSPWRFGVSSFAEFVLFRAGLRLGEDWLEVLRTSSHIDLVPSPNEDCHFENASRSDVEFWFAIQDWHDTAEWHDNLGWASGWVETTHPYLPDASWQQYESR